MHTQALPNKTSYEMVHQKKPDFLATQKWRSNVYVKIKQGDKLPSRAKTVKWIGYSSQISGHYWPNFHKVSVKKNVIFNTEKPH